MRTHKQRQEFLNVVNEENFTTLVGKMFQTFTTRSLKKVEVICSGTNSTSRALRVGHSSIVSA